MDIEAVNSLIDDYKVLIESYKKENKHLKELQRNMDKQYEELEKEKLQLKDDVIALRKGLSKTRIRRDKYKRKYLKEKCKNKSPKNNWNELKEWLKKAEREYRKDIYSAEYGWVIGTISTVLSKMQEIESGKNE